MTQQNNSTSWMIQNNNGQPQMIKLVQPFPSTGKAVTNVMSSAIASALPHFKFYKSTTATSQVDSSQAATQAQPQFVVTNPKIVKKAVPISVSAIQKGTNKIRLTASQLSQMQRINIVNPQKIQLTENSTTVPVIQHSPHQQQQISHQQIHQHSTVINQVKNSSPPILSRKRPDPLALEYAPESKRSRKADKIGKGLRHFSMKVCEKVRKKGTTTYNEVADELVGEFTNPVIDNSNNVNVGMDTSYTDQQYDQKNIRRRVYDALNVLMAMNIISKEKKEIKWIGLPTNSIQECVQLEKEKIKRMARIKEKKKQLQELILNQIAFKNLAKRNKEMEEVNGRPAINSYIELPFIVVSTDKKTIIDCHISDDKMEYRFLFNDIFEITDDIRILKSIGMNMGLDTGECTPENLELMKSMVPASLEDHVVQLAQRTADEIEDMSESECAGTSSMLIGAQDFVETHLDEESRQSSSFDPSSPTIEYSDDEVESDLSSETEVN